MPDITPDLQREIEETAKLLSTKFAQPEFIPGCEVKSITDINLYAANNGWIEAVCGQHNQQRVRWKSSETVIVNDFVDVLYFPDRRVFEVYGIGGSTAITGGASAATQAEVDAGTVAVEYVSPLTFQAGLTTRLSYVLRPDPIINGAHLLWQRGTSFAAAVTSTYTADRWVYYKVGAMEHTISQSTTTPTVAEAGIYYPYSLKLDCTTVDASIAAGDYAVKAHIIEGYNFIGLAQRPFTISFWAYATKTGVYCVSFKNSGQDRSYVAEITINASNTQEYKTITVPASPAAGTWNYTTGVGLNISFVLACGSTFQTTAGAWQTGSFFATANQVNACDSTANDFIITGLKIEPGSVATPFVMPDYEQELGRCLRYARLVTKDAGGRVKEGGIHTGGTGDFGIEIAMRSTPTLSHDATGLGGGAAQIRVYDYQLAADLTVSSFSFTLSGNSSEREAILRLENVTNGTAGHILQLVIGSSVRAILSSEF